MPTLENGAISAQDSILEIKGDGAQWIEIEGVVSYQGFDGKASELDATNLRSKAKEVRPGLQDFGNFTMEVNRNFTDPGQLALIAAKQSRKKCAFRLTYPAKNTDTFDAYVMSFPTNGGVDQIMKVSVSLRVTGEVVSADAPVGG